MPDVFLSLGSNLGDRLENLRRAIARLDAHPEIDVILSSSIYLTEPVGGIQQPDFLNLVLELDTSLEPGDLHAICRDIEVELRRRAGRIAMGPRTIDLDILLYGQLILAEADLTIPHPRMMERAFVLVPLVEIAPDVVIPDNGTAANALAHCTDTSRIERFSTIKESDKP